MVFVKQIMSIIAYKSNTLVRFENINPVSVAMFCEINYNRFTPSKEEVSGGGAKHHSGTQPRVVCHEHQH